MLNDSGKYIISEEKNQENVTNFLFFHNTLLTKLQRWYILTANMVSQVKEDEIQWALQK